jgi:hypothetical protein
MLFFPDIEIAEFAARYVAVEVKILRGAQATGSVTKALGQAVLYRSLGFLSAFVIIVDLRPRSDRAGRSAADWNVLDDAGLSVSWFAGSANGELANLRGRANSD